MKCNEFMSAAECLTPSQLSVLQTDGPAMLAHARECATCGRWLESQCRLASAMQALRASTVEREAGPNVEQAVLLAFRSLEFAPASPAGPDRAAPMMWKLSRFFEVAAYTTVAAALTLAVFLSSRLLHERQTTQARVRTQIAISPQESGAVQTVPVVNTASSQTTSSQIAAKPAATRTVSVHNLQSQKAAGQAATTAAENEGFVALMLCDPLVCSGEEQVIRMELPEAGAVSGGSNAGQPVIADVVIGDDGLVRAMRIVN